jgi:hypothetical protein
MQLLLQAALSPPISHFGGGIYVAGHEPSLVVETSYCEFGV